MKGLEYRVLNDMIRTEYNADRTAIQLNGSTLCGKKYCCMCARARVHVEADSTKNRTDTQYT